MKIKDRKYSYTFSVSVEFHPCKVYFLLTSTIFFEDFRESYYNM